MRAVAVTQVDDGVFFAQTPLVNWVLLVDGDAVTLVDTGYPGQRLMVEESIRVAGRRPQDVQAVLLTHAHVDHIGSADWFAQTYAVPVFVAHAEIPHARREAHHGLDERGVLKNLWRPRMLPWMVQAARVGVTDKRGVSDPRPLPDERPLPVPGGPVALPTSGHTPGHTAYWLPSSGTLISGDAVVTAHPLTSRKGPGLLPAFFDDDRAGATAALRTLAELGSSTLLPGHGPLHRGTWSAPIT